MRTRQDRLVGLKDGAGLGMQVVLGDDIEGQAEPVEKVDDVEVGREPPRCSECK
jgi:hypothetical protein